MLSALIPRNLRVRASVQLGGTRVPARAFLICAGLLFAGGLLVVAGADLLRTVRLTGALIVLALAVFELRCWGRSTREVARILVRHARRPRRLRLERPLVMLPPEAAQAELPRRPRWQQSETGNRRKETRSQETGDRRSIEVAYLVSQEVSCLKRSRVSGLVSQRAPYE